MKKSIAFLAGLVFLGLTGFASAEYTDNEDGTITDSRTNLMWQKAPVQGDWDTANSYCDQTETGFYNDWRMPTLTELQLLVDPAYEYPTIDPIFVCPTYPGYFWTSSVVGDSAWWIDFKYGDASLMVKQEDKGSVRCVRGASAPLNTVKVGTYLSLDIPCLEYNGQLYRIKLKFFQDPNIPAGLYWTFDSMEPK